MKVVDSMFNKDNNIKLKHSQNFLHNSYIFNNSGQNIKSKCKYIFSYKQIKRLSNDIGFKMTDSPRCLSFEQWLKAFQYFVIGVSYEKKRVIYNSYSKLLEE